MFKSIDIEFKVFGMTVSIKKQPKGNSEFSKAIAQSIKDTTIRVMCEHKRQGGMLGDD